MGALQPPPSSLPADPTPMPPDELAFCALATRNYRSQAVTLLDSLRRHHPEAGLYLLEVDGLGAQPADERLAGVRVLSPTEILPAAPFWARATRYDAFELSNSLKAALLRHALDQGHTRAVYLDVDILVLQPLTAGLAALDQAAIVLTPHRLTPLPDDGFEPSDRDLLRAGIYNAGFLGLREGAEARRFLAWWDDKLHAHCHNDPASGLFVDQKWLDFVPAMFQDVALLRAPGYNVAHWNLDERPLTREAGVYRAGGEPLAFFHFSGFDPDSPAVLSKHHTRPLSGSGPALGALLSDYADRLIANGHPTDRQVPYGLGTFSNGAPFDARARALLPAAIREGQAEASAAAFDVAASPSYFAWLTAPAPGRRVSVTRHLLRYHAERPDLQAVFPDVLGKHQQAYLRWLAVNGEAAGLHPLFVAAARAKASAAESAAIALIKVLRGAFRRPAGRQAPPTPGEDTP